MSNRTEVSWPDEHEQSLTFTAEEKRATEPYLNEAVPGRSNDEEAEASIGEEIEDANDEEVMDTHHEEIENENDREIEDVSDVDFEDRPALNRTHRQQKRKHVQRFETEEADDRETSYPDMTGSHGKSSGAEKDDLPESRHKESILAQQERSTDLPLKTPRRAPPPEELESTSHGEPSRHHESKSSPEVEVAIGSRSAPRTEAATPRPARSGPSSEVLASYIIEMDDDSEPMYDAEFQALTDAKMAKNRPDGRYITPHGRPTDALDRAHVRRLLELTCIDFCNQIGQVVPKEMLKEFHNESYESQHRRIQTEFNRRWRGAPPAPAVWHMRSWEGGFDKWTVPKRDDLGQELLATLVNWEETAEREGLL